MQRVVVVVVVREQNVDQNVDVDQQRWHMISGPVPIVYPLYTRNTVEKGTVLPGYGNQEPVPETAHTQNHFTTVLPVPVSCLNLNCNGMKFPFYLRLKNISCNPYQGLSNGIKMLA